jgi:poly(3-hydroxybutyrate) depolymerase
MIKALIGLILLSLPAFGEVLERHGSFGGLPVDYRVVLPSNYDRTKSYPAVLTFGGGDQTVEVTDNLIERVWLAEADRRGYIVIAAAAPNGDLFYHKGPIGIIPAFLTQIFKEFGIDRNRVHIAGPSNGGLSA